MITFNGPRKLDTDFEIFEAKGEERDGPIYSCVVLYRGNWVAGWPALGGTRWFSREDLSNEDAHEAARAEAKELAISMMAKNSLLRHASNALAEEHPSWGVRTNIFGWQGGKGIIWTPTKGRGKLTPYRLMCHGRLLEQIGGEYLASKDQGVGTVELKWIEKASRFTIGLGCEEDTGRATAAGVVAAIMTASAEAGVLSGAPTGHIDWREDQIGDGLSGLTVLVVGAGKVGLPLLKMLDDNGANCLVYDPWLKLDAVDEFFHQTRRRGATVGEEHRRLLLRLARDGRVIEDEKEALTNPTYDVLSPNGGATGWLSRVPSYLEGEGMTRAELLAGVAGSGSPLKLVVGAGNDQLPATASRTAERDAALDVLGTAGIQFLPDPVVSPGGVVAVSHELLSQWDGSRVLSDTFALVRRTTSALYHQARELGGTTAPTMYRAFETLVHANAYATLD